MKWTTVLGTQERRRRAERDGAFTLVELLVVIAIIGVLAGLLMSTLNKARAKTLGIACLNNNRQLVLGWIIYAGDHQDRLVYNIGGVGDRQMVATNFPLNWVNGVLDWELSPDNTNTLLITESGLSPYVNDALNVYKCPSDIVLSEIQKQAGWTGRSRSYSMNAMMGDAGPTSASGYNVNNPYYVQFFKLEAVPDPANMFVFVDEHPDSINDGYFLNRPSTLEWIDLPAAWHNNGSTLAFADGHSEIHQWMYAHTRPPHQPDSALLPFSFPLHERADFDWMVRKTSVYRWTK